MKGGGCEGALRGYRRSRGRRQAAGMAHLQQLSHRLDVHGQARLARTMPDPPLPPPPTPLHSHIEVGGVGALHPAVQGLDVLLHNLDLDANVLDHDLHLAVAVARSLVGDRHLRV